MDPINSTTIDVVEAAYDLDVDGSEWLHKLLATAQPLLDRGLGCVATLTGGLSPEGQPLVMQANSVGGPDDLVRRFFSGARTIDPEMMVRWNHAMAERGVARISELEEEWSEIVAVIRQTMGCKEALYVNAIDPDGRGAFLSTWAPDSFSFTSKDRERWKMVAVHLTAGHRMRCALSDSPSVRGFRSTEIPLNAEAVLDPTKFVVSHAAASAQNKVASEQIRKAAVRVDRARGRLRKSDPDEALEIWHGLVRGRWSLVDWFDTDGRRFVLAKPNAPDLGDPRGLSQSEAQVATYAARGESGKIIGYRFGISPQRVSVLLKSAMHKLGVKTQGQLVEKMRGMPSEPDEN